MGLSLRACGVVAGLCGLLAGPARAEVSNEEIGTSPTALPGLTRVAAAGTFRPGFALALTSGYGYTESVLLTNDSHHRAMGALALSYRPVEAFGAGVKFDGRFDSHSGDETASSMDGSDDGWVGDPRILLRYGADLSPTTRLGAHATVWLPGSEAPSVVGDAISADLMLLASLQPGGGASALHLNAGFRFDNSKNAVDDPAVLSDSDRISLGLSSSNAALVGAGWELKLEKLAVLAEVSWDILVGGEASPVESPLRADLGIRYALGQSLALQVAAEAGLSSRPDLQVIQMTAPAELIPIEPRFSLLFGLTYRPAERSQPIASKGGGPTDTQATPPTAQPGKLAGSVKTADGAPVSGAKLKVGDQELVSGADGSFALEGVAAGAVAIAVTAEGYKDANTTATVRAGETTTLALVMERNLPAGQVRGLVQSFGGQPLAATITIAPGGQTVQSGANGEFEIDLAPGSYTVTISAPGHVDQQRKVKVELNGVTILNVDLRKN